MREAFPRVCKARRDKKPTSTGHLAHGSQPSSAQIQVLLSTGFHTRGLRQIDNHLAGLLEGRCDATLAGASFSGIVQAGSGGQYQPNPKDGASEAQNAAVAKLNIKGSQDLPRSDSFIG